MSHFVLVHGGGHGGWCWEHVAALLMEAGHEVDTPDLPGLGADQTPPGDVTWDMCIERIAGVVLAAPEPVILVGHSLGGMVISDVGEAVPEKIRGLVYVTAALLPTGHTLFSYGGADLPARAGEIRVSEDGTASIVDPPLAKALFYNSTHPKLADHAISRLRPNPSALGRFPVETTPERWGRIPRAYIQCTEDALCPINLQRRMNADNPCQLVLSISCDHSPFYSAPYKLMDNLLEIWRGILNKNTYINK